MGFLGKDAKSGEYVSVISEQCQFQGTLDLQGSLRIDGKLEGNVDNAKYVTISQSGKVKGDITAKGVVLIGRMEGNICADTVELLASARISGDIRSKSILIEGGAKVNATIHVVNEDGEDAAAEEEVLDGSDEPEAAATGAHRAKKGAK